jgi:hypothetical protein
VQPVVDALAPPQPEQSAVASTSAKRLPTEEEAQNYADQLTIQYQRYAPGNSLLISAGQRLAIVQEMFGTPHGKTVLIAVLSRQPDSPSTPEPLVSRHIANLTCVLRKESDEAKWTLEPWSTYDTKVVRFKKRPAWMLSVFGHVRQGDDLSDALNATPLETVAEQEEREVITTRNLSNVLKILSEGTSEEQIACILHLHKRLYHRKPDELRTLLNKSGVPLRTLTFVEEACKRCEVCRRWSAIGTKAAVKTRLSGRFNHMIYADLVFIGQPPAMFFVCVDDAIRYTTVHYLEWKDFSCLEKAFRRSWIQHFGPPAIIRSD